MTRPPLLLYCQHSLGLGHLKRSWALAEELTSAFEVTLVTGGARPHDLRPPQGIALIDLPALSQDGAGRLIVADDGVPLEIVQQRRTRRLLDAYDAVRPAVVVIELYPFGRRKFSGELTQLLDRTQQRPRPVVATSVRDLLIDRGADQQRHDDRAHAALETYFDAVLVHADPCFSTLSETFRPTAPLTIPVYHTGFVVGPAATAAAPSRSSRILVSGGGGRFAERLYFTALEAHELLGPDAPSMTIVAGPLCPDDTLERLYTEAQRRPKVHVARTVGNLANEMRASALSLSQCGYNTALDILRAQVPAVVVPFADNGDSEQADRARRLERLNAVRVLPADRLEPEALAAALRSALSFRPDPVSLDFGGAAATTRIVKALHERRRAERLGDRVEGTYASLA
jgi:predicted glycosyltransferase